MAPDTSRKAQADETSPLLSKQTSTAPQIAADSGIAPGGANTYVDDEQDGGDIEPQASHGDSHKHHGMPEVKKQMKYIFPAIAIGVSKTTLPVNR